LRSATPWHNVTWYRSRGWPRSRGVEITSTIGKVRARYNSLGRGHVVQRHVVRITWCEWEVRVMRSATSFSSRSRVFCGSNSRMWSQRQSDVVADSRTESRTAARSRGRSRMVVDGRVWSPVVACGRRARRGGCAIAGTPSPPTGRRRRSPSCCAPGAAGSAAAR